MESSEENRLQVWTEAAAWALCRQQGPAAQRLLLMTMDAATQAGWLQLADVARDRLVTLNPKHQVATFPTAADALRDDDISTLVRSVGRQIRFEEAERMVTSRPADDRLTLDPDSPAEPQLVKLLDKRDE